MAWLKDVNRDNLQIVINNPRIVDKVFKNADFINATELQIVVIKTIEYSKNTLGIETIEDFYEELYFASLYKDIINLNKSMDWKELYNTLWKIIKKIWDENSNFKKIWKSMENIVHYFQQLHNYWVTKLEITNFINEISYIYEEDEEENFSPWDVDNFMKNDNSIIDDLFNIFKGKK